MSGSSSSRQHTAFTGSKGNPHDARAGRILLFLALCTVAGVLGYFTYYKLTESEFEIAEQMFASIASRSTQSAIETVERKRLGTVSMATLASYANPTADAWPFVVIQGYEDISTNLIATSSASGMLFAPLIEPTDLQEFEDFAYTHYNTSRLPEPFPEGTAESSFGKGVWGVDPTINSADHRYHETDGNTSYNSPHKIFAPVLHHSSGAFLGLMLNLHFKENAGTAIDSLIDCAASRAAVGDTSVQCSQITNVIVPSQNIDDRPGAVIVQPIYPANNATVLTGFIASYIAWDELFKNVFGGSMKGIHCVVESDTQVYTYQVDKGVVTLSGTGDLHETAYDKYGQSISLSRTDFFSEDSLSFTLTLYPTEEFFRVCSTHNPRTATIGVVLIILVTSILFMLYDYFVRREFTAKTDLLEAKRKYMRFVSHEVRTPLNSLCLGLALMSDEMSTALGGVSGSKYLSQQRTATTNDTAGAMVKSVESKNVIDWLSLAKEVSCNAQSAVDVLNDLLNYDKIEMGQLSLELTVIPIWDLIRQTTSEFNLQAAKKKIKYVVEASPTEANSEELDKSDTFLPPDLTDRKVVGDQLRIAQGLRNLVSNALKFTPEEGSLTVVVSWMDTNKRPIQKFKLQDGEEVSFPQTGFVEVSVSDTGVGMSQDQLERLFRDGVQFNVNKLQAGQGSGLGLYITKGIVEQHGGTLTVLSDGLNMGATFKMILPLHLAPDEKGCTVVTDSVVNESYGHLEELKQPDSRPLRILVVDDSDMNRKLLTRLLQNQGHQCDQAVDGVEAVNQVKQSIADSNPYDTILLDYEMPVMNGPTAAVEIRAMGGDAFIVGITGNILPDDVSYFKACGANAVLPKPFQMSDLEGLWVEYGVTGRCSDLLCKIV